MRAEMTVGLDLKSLENLRIYNGYEKEKKTRRLSLEAPSSPESDVSHQYSNSTQGRHHKPKCGRPANPIPRHKRDSHIKAEYKRRDKIQKGFDILVSLVPELSEVTGKESKSAMLFKTAEHCRRLDSERGNSQKELTALRQELEALGTQIQVLQEQLPCHGVEAVKEEDGDVSMDTLFDQYVQEKTKKNWKFWIFGFFMRPLFESFRQSVESKLNREEFDSSVLQWVKNKLSLTNLRKGFLDALRGISKYTSIMTNPEKLEIESKTRMAEHCIKTVQSSASSISFSTPPGTPRARTPAPVSSAGRTPATTPVASPPRTPNISRRSSRHETVRATESRSRSNSPEEVRTKRRSSYRSRSGKRSPGTSFREEKDIKVEYNAMNTGPKMPLLSHLLTSPQSNVIGKIEPVVMVTTSDNGMTTIAPASPSKVYKQPVAAVVSSSLNNHTVSSMNQRNHEDDSAQNKQLTAFIESLFSEKPQMNNTKPKVTVGAETKTSNTSAVRSTYASEGLSYHANTHRSIITTTSNEMAISACSTGQYVNSFVPLITSGIISNNSVMQGEPSVAFTELLPMEVSMPAEFNSDLLLNSLQLFSSSSSDHAPMTTHSQTSLSNTSTDMNSIARYTSTDMNSSARSDILNTDEDSLTCMLGLDVLDVNSVFKFFEEKSQS